MATRPLPSILVGLGPSASAEPDAELLARYVSTHDEAAFALLVRRYARLVWRVARTRCRSESTAEDVFQATFVVLSRKAGSIRTGGALPGWLHRTALRLAVKAARHDRPTAPLPTDTPVSVDPLDALSARELLVAVDDELAKLSDAERSVLVLCGVENQSLDEAATRLGCTVGAVKGRLERSRAKLRTRLSARGLTLPAVVLSLFGMPSRNTLQAATLAALDGVIRPSAAALLAHGVSMKGTITKAALGVALLGALLTLGTFRNGADTPTATAAPVPKDKDKGSAVLWSEPVKVDWKASGAERLAGVWTPDGKSVLVASSTVAEQDEKLDFGGVDFRDTDTGKVTKKLDYKPNGKLDQMFLPQTLAVSPDGQTVYASGAAFTPGGKGEAARALVTWTKVDKNKPPFVTVFADPTESPLALSPDGKLLGTFTNGDTVEVQESDTFKVNWRNALGGGKRGKLTALTFNAPDGYLAVGTRNGEWMSLNVKSGQTVHVIADLGMSVRATAASADGKNLAFGGEMVSGGQPLLVFAVKEIHKIADAVPNKEAVNGLTFSPDGKKLVAACTDGEVRVFDVEKGKLITSAKEHKEAVFSVAYSPDGKKLLTVGKDAIKLWDVERLLKAK